MMSELPHILDELEEVLFLTLGPAPSIAPDSGSPAECAVALIGKARAEWTAAATESQRLAAAQGDAIVNSAMIMSELQEAKEALEAEIVEHHRAEEEIKELNAELERRVADRTAELQATNQVLRQEIAQREEAEERLVHDALHDALTSLPNRQMLLQRVSECLHRASESSTYLFAVLFLDLDNFKLINDSLGHSLGDQLLVQTASRIAAIVDSTVPSRQCMIVRLGGDEFVVLLEGISSFVEAIHLAERLQVGFAESIRVNDHEFFVSSSIGIAMNEETADVETLLRNADTAMYRAKHAGKARYAVFNEQMHGEVRARLSMENELRTAIDDKQLTVWYQPIISLRTGEIAAFEALARWRHPLHGWIAPMQFIPIAEEAGMIVPLGRWILAQVCAQLLAWRREIPTARGITASVNVSKMQLIESSFLKDMEQISVESGIGPGDISLEITESCVIETSESMLPTLQQLKTLGFNLHMDDFGTGYSSLSCLHQFPFDVLKIDRSFIMDLDGNREYAAVIHAINTLARNLGMKVIAEGLESRDQLAPILAIDCDYAQGYYFARPMDAAAAGALLQSEHPWLTQLEAVKTDVVGLYSA